MCARAPCRWEWGGTIARARGAWRQLLADGLHRHGVAPQPAADLATLTVSALEGATLLARVEQRAHAIDRSTTLITSLIRNQAAYR